MKGCSKRAWFRDLDCWRLTNSNEFMLRGMSSDSANLISDI